MASDGRRRPIPGAGRPSQSSRTRATRQLSLPLVSERLVIGEVEAQLRRDHGPLLVAGVDEAGRGPLAGPVVAAAVVLDPHRPPPPGLDDSKRLSAARRHTLNDYVRAHALSWGVRFVSPSRVDEINILQATLEAMAGALAGLACEPDLVLVDGNVLVPGVDRQRCLVRGDRRSHNIAAASVLAKVARDRAMVELGARYPGYGFERHMGYPTAAHRAAIRRLGPCPAHRRSFRLLPEQERA